MLSNIILASLAFLAMICVSTAAPDPQYQTPTVTYPAWEEGASNHCGDSTFTCMYWSPLLGTAYPQRIDYPGHLTKTITPMSLTIWLLT